MEFNEKLQALRKQKGLTQEELAEKLYISRTAVSKWESGRGYPNIDSLKAISKLFGITIDELLSGDELLNIAEEDTKLKERALRDLIFGLLDCSMALLLFLPLFGQKADGVFRAVSLLALSDILGLGIVGSAVILICNNKICIYLVNVVKAQIRGLGFKIVVKILYKSYLKM